MLRQSQCLRIDFLFLLGFSIKATVKCVDQSHGFMTIDFGQNAANFSANLAFARNI